MNGKVKQKNPWYSNDLSFLRVKGGPWSIQTLAEHPGFAFKIRIMIYSYRNRTSWEYSIWILHRKNGTQSPIFFQLLKKNRPWIFFSIKLGVFSPPKKVANDLWIQVKVISWAVVSDVFRSLQGASEESLSGAVGKGGETYNSSPKSQCFVVCLSKSL